MSDFTSFKSEDFLADETFVNYLMEKNLKDVDFWKKWITGNPECYDEVEEARLLFFILKDQQDIAHEPAKLSDIDKQYSKLSLLLQKENVEVERDRKMTFHKGKSAQETNRFRRIILFSAGVAAIFLVVASLWIFLAPAKEYSNKAGYVLFATTGSNKKEVTLPDGSHVQLNNNSTIKITTEFNTNKREVLLTGSAFFEVRENPSKPFIVTAGALKTTVLGTSFYIYGLNNTSTSVSLLKGKVRVDENGKHLELMPGEKATYNPGSGIVKGAFNTEQFLLWRKGEVHFEHAHWNEIKSFIEEYYNREVLVKGEVPKLNFTGNFDAEKLETLLDVLNFTYNAEYKLDKQKVIIAFTNN